MAGWILAGASRIEYQFRSQYATSVFGTVISWLRHSTRAESGPIADNSPEDSIASPHPPGSRKIQFVYNVVWGWLGVAVNILIGLVLSPIIVQKLGVGRYGVWVLLFSTIEYVRMLDLGFRTAVVNAAARLRARQDWAGVNATVLTATVYFVVVAAACCLVVVGLRDVIVDAFDIPAPLDAEARTLIAVVAATVTLRFAFTPIPSTLEAFQRFDLVNRAYICALVFRSTGSIALLTLGYGLIEMAYVVLLAQIGEVVWNAVSLKRVFPAFRVSPALVQRGALSTMFGFARHSAVMSAANMLCLQAPTTVLGLLRGPIEVGFFALPNRLLMYITEAVGKVSDVTSSVTAALHETGDRERVWRLAVMTNRHCFALFLPAAVFLAVYAAPLLAVWISPDVAYVSGPLIPVLLIGYLFGFAGQYNAGGILLGQGKHALYAYGVVAEMVVSVAVLFAVVPRYGALGAAWVTSLLGIGRGVYLAVGLCRLNHFPLGQYLRGVYARPLAVAVPVALLAVVLRAFVWRGRTWLELILAGGVISAAFFAVAFFTVLEPDARARFIRLLPGRKHQPQTG